MKDMIEFLRELKMNNNREWFCKNKHRYQEVQGRFNEFTERLIHGIASFDPTVANLGVKDCTYRIYRDVRFSEDKSPYKTHLGAVICRGGKKSGFAGYYFQIAAGTDEDENVPHWDCCHMIASGHYCYDPKALQILREDILAGNGDFDDIVKNEADKRFHLDTSDSLKRNPKGFPADAPYSEYLRLKSFCLISMPDDDFVQSPSLCDNLTDLFKTTKPFIDYINRAIEYAKDN